MNDKTKGIYQNYNVERLRDEAGKHKYCQYFVLDPVHDGFAIPALLAYADACEKDYPLLASDLRRMTETKEKK